MSEKLSKYVSLSEVVHSDSAKRLKIDNNPTDEHLENLKTLSVEVFDKVREFVGGPLFISSGYRSEALNKATPGASKTSDHSVGCALDLDCDRFEGKKNSEIFNYIKDNLEFKQLIWEFGNSAEPDWVHVSYKKGANKKQILRAVKRNGKTIYEIWK
jgi:zinc D-Ala-D-Ala carboxypeptidase